MPQVSPVLALPFIQAAQAQKHVTHNEALQILDLAVQLAVDSRSQGTPPAAAPAGTRHIVPPGATGAWTGQAGRIALRDDGDWRFADPAPGWRAHVLDEGATVVFDGTGWVVPALGAASADRLGINATADAVNRLAVAAQATLLNHDGAGHQLKINKNGPTETASLLFQTGFSGQAEMGTLGGGDFSVKVSPDGATWHDALVADRNSGQVALPNGLGVTGQITGTAVTQGATDTTPGRLLKVGDYGWGTVGVNLDSGADLDAIPNMGFGNNAQTSVPANDPLGSGNRRFAGIQFGSVNAQAQIMLDASASDRQRLFCRIRSIGTWGAWFAPLIATSAPPAPPNGDFNDAIAFGPTQTFSAATNRPAGNGHAVLTLPRSATNFAQLSMRTDTALRYDTLLQGRQISSAGGVGAWVNFFHTRNIVGTVSETDGIPTGAVIERGASGGFEYEKLADGTMRCWGHVDGTVDITTASNTGAGFVSGGVTFPFPVPFVHNASAGVQPVVIAQSRAANPYALVASTSHDTDMSGNAVTGIVRLRRDTSLTDVPYALQVMVQGRWR
jgi:hypothetical protein